MKQNAIAIILVKPENPDNIGAVARAMKNMSFRELRLVKPPKNWQSKGEKLAMAAADILDKATVYDSLPEAAEDCQRVIALSRRYGTRRGTFYPLGTTINKVRKESARKKIAFVFGRESKGLDNKDLAFCDWTTTIPTDPDCPSINLSQSVMLMTFALAHGQFSMRKEKDKILDLRSVHVKAAMKEVNKKEILAVLESLRQSLVALDYKEEGADVIDRIQATFYGMIKRSGMIKSEAQMLKGLSRRIRERVVKRVKK